MDDRLAESPPSHANGRIRAAGAIGGLLLFVGILLLPTPEGLDWRGQRCLAVTCLMGALWMTEAIPIPVTSVLPILLFPLLGVASSNETAGRYANDLIFLFFGGFFLALALEKHGLHLRMALRVMALFGTKPITLILGIMVAVAFLSMWISNTAATLMMLPICLAMVGQVERHTTDPAIRKAFTTALLLGTAYGANVGGMGTPIGTPTNGIFLGQWEGRGAPTFFEWMQFGVPLVAVFLLFLWVMLTRVLFRFPKGLELGDADFVKRRLHELGRLSSEERRVLAIFGLTVALWVTRGGLDLGFVDIPGWVDGLAAIGFGHLVSGAREGVGDSAAAILAVILLCSIRGRKGGDRLADWSLATRVPWGMLFLFGGGFAIAYAFQIHDEDTQSLSQWVGGFLSRSERGPHFLLPATSFLITFLTEFTSNTATSSVMVPIVSGIEPERLGRLLALATVLSASCAFMLPVATPPNAIVFGSKRLGIRDMMRAGILINIVGAVIVSGTVWLVARYVLPG